MSENSISNSRRNVLKAGVGLGVGAVAWSGPTITSLGGTPAYAAVCTQAATLNVDLITDTNTNKSCSSGNNKYLTFQANLSTTVPAQYNLDVSGVLGFCADAPRTISWSTPADEICKITFKLYNANGDNIQVNPSPDNIGSSSFERSSTTGSLVLPLLSVAGPSNQRDSTVGTDLLLPSPSGRYGITMVCVPGGAQCFPDGA